MRIMPVLAVAAALLGACAHGVPGRDVRAEARRAVSERMPALEVCLPVGFTDAGGPEGAFAILAEMQANGAYAFEPGRRGRFDALVEAGLLTLEEVVRGQSEVPVRIYRLTPLGAEHYRQSELSADGSGSPPRFCYGRGEAVRIWEIDWTDWGGCAEALYVSVLYRYGIFPDWAETPALRAAFPDWIGRASADVVRYRRLTFLRIGERWQPGRFNAAHSTCVSPRRTRHRRLGA